VGFEDLALHKTPRRPSNRVIRHNPEAGMDATLVSTWTALCQQLAPAFTTPTLLTFVHLLSGWALCPGRAVVTHFICAIGASLLGHASKHWTAYEKFFYRAAWEPDDVSGLLLRKVVEPLLSECCEQDQGTIDLLIDDTTAGRSGEHVALAGYFKDASVSNTRTKVVHWSHNWIIGVVGVRPSRWKGWVMGLPVLAALYRKQEDCDQAHPFLTRQQLAARLIRQTHQALPNRTIRVKADGQYATKEVAGACFEVNGVLVSRLRGDSALFALPPKQKRPGGGGKRPAGRKRRGRRLATPKAMARSGKGWRTIYLTLDGKKVRRRIKSLTCLWWHVAKDHPLKVVIVKNQTGKGRDDYLFSTDPAMSEQQIIQEYDARWPVEEAIHDAKQHDGFEQTMGWCEHTVLRQAPLALFKQTLVKAWYARCAPTLEKRAGAMPPQPWQPLKSHPSYRDMLAALRLTLWRARVGCFNSAGTSRVRDAFKAMVFTLCAAA
jgi:DDE superfamily endonuclease